MAHDRDQAVVALGFEAHDLGPQLAHCGRHGGECIVGRVGGRSEHPHRSYEHLGVGAIETVEFATSHRMTGHESRVGDRPSQSRLDTAHVGHDTGRVAQRSLDFSAQRLGWNRHERDRGIGSQARLVNDSALPSYGDACVVDIGSVDVPAALGQRQSDRSPDEAEAKDVGDPITHRHEGTEPRHW